MDSFFAWIPYIRTVLFEMTGLLLKLHARMWLKDVESIKFLIEVYIFEMHFEKFCSAGMRDFS